MSWKDDEDPSAEPANCWIRFLAGAGCPLCACCSFFGVGWMFTFIFIMYARAKGTDVITFESPVVKSDLTVQQYYAVMAARGVVPGCNDKNHEDENVCKNDDKCTWQNQKCKDKDVCPSPALREREGVLYVDGAPAWVGIVYEAQKGANMLDNDILKYVDSYEKELMTSANYAMFRNGTQGQWDKHYCKLAYNVIGNESKCSDASTLINVFSMNEQGRNAVEEQVQAGYSGAGALSCMCSMENALCPICNSDGTLKGTSDWPTDIKSCMTQKGFFTTPTAATISEAQCARSFEDLPFALLKPQLEATCATKPSCQWAAPGTSPFCSSTGFYAATDNNGLVTGAEKETMLDNLCNDDYTGYSLLRSTLLPQKFDCQASKKSTQFMRTFYMTGGNPGNEAEMEAEAKTFSKEYVEGPKGWYAAEQKLERDIESASDNRLRIMLFSWVTLFTQYLNILMIDGLLAICSLVFVWLYMWWTLESCFLASCAMFEIVFSLPVVMCLWTVVCQQKIQFMQCLTVYMILGIGADDAFILYDAWMQAGHDLGAGTSCMKRFDWAYRRSFKAMAVTTATTCGSFLIGACSPLPQVRDFCIFAALVVLVDWLFCESFFAAAVVVNERFLKTSNRRGECCGPGCCCGLCQVAIASCCSSYASSQPTGGSTEPRPMEKFCKGPLFNFLRRFKLLLIGFWMLFAVAMLISCAAFLRTAEKLPKPGRDSLDAMRGWEVLIEEFSFMGVPKLTMAFGLEEDDPMKGWGDTHDSDVPQYDQGAFDKITSKKGQLEMLSLCRAADLGQQDDTRCNSQTCLIKGKATPGKCTRSEKLWIENGVYMSEDPLCLNGRYCYMEVFAQFWAYHIQGKDCVGKAQGTCPTSGCKWDTTYKKCATTASEDDYPGLDADTFIGHMKSIEFTDYKSLRQTKIIAAGRAYTVENERVETGYREKFTWIGYNATYPRYNSVEQANNWHKRWKDFHDKYAPTIGGIQTTEMYTFMVTQNELVKAAILGVCLSLVVTGIVLLVVTRNWWITTIGMCNLLAIVCVFLGLMPIIGWSLGQNECIFLIAVVGLSVDYSVHLVHVYNTSWYSDREKRAQHALTEMGISVTNSAVTTLLAAAILFNCGFYFFLQFGAFIFLVISFSIAMSILFLIPLLLTIGPEGSQGDLPFYPQDRSGKGKPDGAVDGFDNSVSTTHE